MFDCSQKQQDFFFDKVYENNKDLPWSYLACLFIFGIYIKENKEYWTEEMISYWHCRRRLPYQYVYGYMLIEEDLPLDVFLQSVKYPCNSQFIIMSYLKYNRELDEMIKENTKVLLNTRGTITWDVLKEVVKDPDIKHLLTTRSIIKLKETVAKRIETIKQYKRGDIFKKIPGIGLECLGYLLAEFYPTDNGFQILRALRGPKIKSDNFIPNDLMPEVKLANYHDGSWDELIYYLTKEDNPELIKMIENHISEENKDENIRIFINRLSRFTSPGSNCFSYILELIDKYLNKDEPVVYKELRDNEEKEDEDREDVDSFNDSSSSEEIDGLHMSAPENFQAFYSLYQKLANKKVKFSFGTKYLELAKIICGKFDYVDNYNCDSSSSDSE